jgi:hypothetical protein
MASLKALTDDVEVDEILHYLRACDTQDRAARLTAQNVHAIVSLLDHLFTATALVPAVRGALIDLLRLARSEKLAELLVKIDPEGDIGRLAKVA